jgi:ABC-type amino acid transport substrate-binding protein
MAREALELVLAGRVDVVLTDPTSATAVRAQLAAGVRQS